MNINITTDKTIKNKCLELNIGTVGSIYVVIVTT